MTGPQSGGRRAGRTLRWVNELKLKPDGRMALLVHTVAMKDYLVRMLRDVRPDIAPRCNVYVVDSLYDFDRLRGWAGFEPNSFEADHAWFEHVTPKMRDLYDTLKRLARGRKSG